MRFDLTKSVIGIVANILLLQITFVSTTCLKKEVCIGTHVHISPNDIKDYCGCVNILGNLAVQGTPGNVLNSTTFDDLKELKEITGYFDFRNINIGIFILPSLRIIRGEAGRLFNPLGTSIQNYYSLFFFNCTIDQILFPKLTRILQYSIALIYPPSQSLNDINTYLESNTSCNLYGLNWRDIYNDVSVEFRINPDSKNLDNTNIVLDLPLNCNIYNYYNVCLQCNENHCWNGTYCQILTTTYSSFCSPACQNGCFDYPTMNSTNCCHSECLGGCDGPLIENCFGCKNRNNNGACVDNCPTPFYYDPATNTFQFIANPRFQISSHYCVNACPINWVLANKVECISSCPDGYTARQVDGYLQCLRCGRLCPKECPGVAIGHDSITNATINDYINCTIITGSIDLDVFSFNSLSAEQFRYFENIEEIRGYLYIFSSTNFIEFNYFKQLRIITGNSKVDDRFSLFIFNNNFTTVDLSSLETISAGEIAVVNNPHLCYIANLSCYVNNHQIQTITEFGNAISCNCHEQCDDRCKCWGPNQDNCVLCKNYSLNSYCIANCDVFSGYYPNTETMKCLPCHPECLDNCTGGLYNDCRACKNFNHSGNCVSNCPSETYSDSMICRDCNSVCKSGCNGPLNTISNIAGCNFCDAVQIDQFGNQVKCLTMSETLDINIYFKSTENIYNIVNNSLVSDSFANSLIYVWKPCHELCIGCYGLLATECIDCIYFDENGTCVNSCNPLIYFGEDKNCLECDLQCNGCFGRGSDKCNNCKYLTMGSICVDTCASGYYNNNNQCEICHDSCLECSGSSKFDCIECSSSKFITRINLNEAFCNSTCGENYFEDKNILECKLCHDLCQTCFGGSNIENCTECKYAELNGACVNNCSDNLLLGDNKLCYYNYTNDTINVISMGDFLNEDDKMYIIIAFLIAIISIVCIILLIITIISLYLRRRRKNIKINEDFANPTYGTVSNNANETLELNPLTLESECKTITWDMPLNTSEAKYEADMSKLIIIDVSSLTKHEILGQGAFGTVYRGTWTNLEGTICDVAIKELNQDAPVEDMQELIKEAVILAKVQHIYLVRLFCICMSETLMVINELVEGGALLSYLKENKNNLSPKNLLTFMYQISNGMEHLESRKMVHRDLAARNILVKSKDFVKISDFGLSRMLDTDQNQYISSGGKIPIRWMPLESIFYKKYTSKSDVWSFGITSWEILTFGNRPYGDLPPQEVVDLLMNGQRLENPENCSSDIYSLLIDCWSLDEDNRPDFGSISNTLNSMLLNSSLYIFIDSEININNNNKDIPPQYNTPYEEIDEKLSDYLSANIKNFPNPFKNNDKMDIIDNVAEYLCSEDSTYTEMHPKYKLAETIEDANPMNSSTVFSNQMTDFTANDYEQASDCTHAQIDGKFEIVKQVECTIYTSNPIEYLNSDDTYENSLLFNQIDSTIIPEEYQYVESNSNKYIDQSDFISNSIVPIEDKFCTP